MTDEEIAELAADLFKNKLSPLTERQLKDLCAGKEVLQRFDHRPGIKTKCVRDVNNEGYGSLWVLEDPEDSKDILKAVEVEDRVRNFLLWFTSLTLMVLGVQLALVLTGTAPLVLICLTSLIAIFLWIPVLYEDVTKYIALKMVERHKGVTIEMTNTVKSEEDGRTP